MSIWVLGVIFGLIFLTLVLMVILSNQKFKEINRAYGKPYKAKIIKIVGGHPELKGGTSSLAFHPGSAISFNKNVFTLAQIISVQVSDQFILLTVVDEHGESQIIFTAEKGFDEISSELLRVWKRYNVM